MTHKTKPQIGQTFNPYKMFTGLFVPEALARCRTINAGAKLIYGRLARYAGQDGNCYPSVPKLAAEVGIKGRQAQKYLAELERAKLIRRIPRCSEGGQTSNLYVFLWHPLFEDGVTDSAPEGVTDPAPAPVTDRTPKESQIQEGHVEEKNRDLDCLARFAIKRDSRQESSSSKYPRLRDQLTDYMVTDEDTERVYPSDRIVVDVMDAAGGASEDQVIQSLHYLRNERGLLPGTKQGPRTFSWFKTVVADYFQQKIDRGIVFTLQGNNGQKQRIGLSQDELDSMTDAFSTN